MTQRRLAELLGWEEAKVSDLVKGKGGVTEVELAMLLGLCGVKPDEARRLLALYNETREKGYLTFPEDGVPDQVRCLIEQERLAKEIVVWSMNLIPGLLQVAAYIHAATIRSALVLPADVDAVVKAKLERQAIFHRSRHFLFYVHEQALRLPVGGPEVMKAQLLHVLAMTVRPYITFRVIPTAFGAHAGLSSSFVQLKYEKYEPVVFVESHNSGLFLEDKGSLDVYTKVLNHLGQQALDEEQSRELITSIVS